MTATLPTDTTSKSSTTAKTQELAQLAESGSAAPERKPASPVPAIIFVCGVVALFIAGYFFLQKDNDVDNEASDETDIDGTIAAARPAFAEFSIDLPSVIPAVPVYTIGTNFSNVVNFGRFNFSSTVKDRLEDDNFAVVGTTSGFEEFFSVYTSNVSNDLPSFITTDAVLHTYHLAYDDALKSLEQAVFYDDVLAVSTYLFETSQEQYQYYTEQGNSAFAEAAKRNVAYFGIALKLLGQTVTVPDYALDSFTTDLAAITAHTNMTCSAIMTPGDTDSRTCYQEDFTQYVPRGHYTKTDRLKQYFKAMMWYGRMTFRQREASESASALLITYALTADEDALKQWADVYDATSFMIGSSDDLGVYEYSNVFDESYSDATDLAALSSEAAFAEFVESISDLRAPSINSMIVWADKDTEEETKGFRLMGQRYVLDADVFQRLIYKEVMANGDGKYRQLPKSLDVMAAMGSETAQEILEDEGDFDYAGYPDNMEDLQEQIDSLEEEDWSQNLYYGWLYMLKPLTDIVDDGYPPFMVSDSWRYKDLNTYQGSWTELKHDTLLYAKQAYSGMGAGQFEYVDLDDRGYVEPRAEVYARLEALANMTLDGLTDRGLLERVDYEYSEGSGKPCSDAREGESCKMVYTYSAEELETNLETIATMAGRLKDISAAELNNEALSDDDYEYMKTIGDTFHDIWYLTIHTDDMDEHQALYKNPVMLVADVATDPTDGNVLEEGTGKIMDIYVIIPVPGESGTYYRIARGGVWSQYEFTVPAAERMTDETWRAIVRDGSELPELSDWKKDYIFEDVELRIKGAPIIYDLGGYYTHATAKQDCEEMNGTYETCGNVCLEYEPDCDTACKPICRMY